MCVQVPGELIQTDIRAQTVDKEVLNRMQSPEHNLRAESGGQNTSSNEYGNIGNFRRDDETMMIMINSDHHKKSALAEQQADTPSLPQGKNFPPSSQSAVSTKQSVMAKVLARNPSASSRLRTQTNPNDSNDYDTVDLMRSKLRGQRSATPGDSQSSERIMNYYLKQADERGVPQRLPFTDESAVDEERLLQVIESNLGDVSLHVQEEYQGKLEDTPGQHEVPEGYASFNPLGRNFFAPRRDEAPTRHLAPVLPDRHSAHASRHESNQYGPNSRQVFDRHDEDYLPRMTDSTDFQKHYRTAGNQQELQASRHYTQGTSSVDKRIGAAGYTPSHYPGPSRMSQTSLQPPGDEGYSYVNPEGTGTYYMDREARQNSARANILGVEDAEEELQQMHDGRFNRGAGPRQGEPKQVSRMEGGQADHLQEHSGEEDLYQKQDGPKHFELRMLEMYHEWYQEDFERSVLSKQGDTYDPVHHLIRHLRSSVPKNRVGALTQIYKLIYTSALEDLERIKEIVVELGQLVVSRRNCVYSLCLALEVLYFVGPVYSWMKLPQFISVLGELAAYYECEEVQRKTIRVLFGLGTEGIKELIRICNLSPEVASLSS